MKIQRIAFWYSMLIIALCIVSIFSLSIGASKISLHSFFSALQAGLKNQTLSTEQLIIWKLRIPRLLLAILCGSGLAVSGAGFQGFFRNPLADPFVIGASSGAALGAAIGIIFFPAGFFLNIEVTLPIESVFAFLGALAATFLAFGIARSAGKPPPAAALLLAGSALSSLFSALLSLLLVLHDKDLNRVWYWLLGSFATSNFAALRSAAFFIIPSMLLLFLCWKPLDLLLSGESNAESLGVNVRVTRLVVAIFSSLAAAASVSVVGIIGFVGLIAPHIARLLVGPSHRHVLPISAISGAILLVAADIGARLFIPPLELPVAVLTSVIGAPFFIFLLVRGGGKLGAFT